MMGPLRLGARVKVAAATDRPDLDVFSEEPSRILVSFDAHCEPEVRAMVKTYGAALNVLGDVGGSELLLLGNGGVPVEALAQAYRAGFPEIFAAKA